MLWAVTEAQEMTYDVSALRPDIRTEALTPKHKMLSQTVKQVTLSVSLSLHITELLLCLLPNPPHSTHILPAILTATHPQANPLLNN